jgi:hypothetical protein
MGNLRVNIEEEKLLRLYQINLSAIKGIFLFANVNFLTQLPIRFVGEIETS